MSLVLRILIVEIVRRNVKEVIDILIEKGYQYQ
jgi:hypothetical protein